MMKKIKIQYLIFPALCFFVLIFGLSDVFAAQGGTPATGSSGGATFTNPIGYTTVDGVLEKVLTTVQGIVATLAVLMIVVGGILYITSAGDQGRVQLAKTAVTSAIIGLALAIAAPTFLYEIYNVLGATQPGATQGASTLSQVLTEALKVLLGIIGTLSVLMLVVGGVMYMTAAGDQTRADTAKKTIQFAIIGLIVAILSLVIVTAIAGIF